LETPPSAATPEEEEEEEEVREEGGCGEAAGRQSMPMPLTRVTPAV
jgi:hypothetical protein